MEFKLRPFEISDLADLIKAANNPKIAANLTNRFTYPYTEDNGRAFIEFATKDHPVHIFTIDIHGKASGGIGIHPQEDVWIKNAELGYWLAEPYWGQGIMTKAILQMVDFGFNTFKINRIFARPYGRNKASQHILEKCGFQLEATLEKTLFKNGEYEDELIYAIRRTH